jgi:hypothetical protein
MLSIGRIGEGMRTKTLVIFQPIVTLDKVICLNSIILIVVTQPQFTKKLGLPSAEKNSH